LITPRPTRAGRAPEIALLVVLILGPIRSAAAVSLADAPPLHGPVTLFHPYPLARVDNAAAAVANPAGLAARPSSELLVLATDSDALRDGEIGVILKRLDFGLAYERYRPFRDGPSVARFTVASARRLSRTLFFGSSYAWYFSKDDSLADLASLDLGLLARWPPHVSIAMTATGVNRPDYGASRIDRRYALGIGYSPVRRLVLFAEDVLAGGTSLGETAPAYGIEVEPTRGIVLRGRADTDGDFRIGIEYNFDQSTFGIVGLFDNDGDSAARAGYVRMTDETYQPEAARPGAGRRGRR